MPDAARYNSTSCIRVLLRYAPHLLDAVDDVDKETPLLYAVLYDKRDIEKMLPRAGADVRSKIKYDNTVFDYARNDEEVLEILNQHQQVSGIL